MRVFLTLFSLAMFSALLEGAFMAIFTVGIYFLSKSILWALVSLIISRLNSIFALVVYLAIEYYFNNGHLTIYSALLAGVTVIQLVYFMYLAPKSEST